MTWPLAMTVAIEQVIGIVLVVSGVFAIGAVAFGEEKTHRIATIVLALIRLVTGLLLLVYIKPGVLAITAVLGAFFLRGRRGVRRLVLRVAAESRVDPHPAQRPPRLRARRHDLRALSLECRVGRGSALRHQLGLLWRVAAELRPRASESVTHRTFRGIAIACLR